MPQSCIFNTAERDAVIERVKAAQAKPKQRFATDSKRARWLARGESAIGIQGGFPNMIILSPRGVRGPSDEDRFLYYGSNGVLVHEESTSGKPEVHQLFTQAGL